jgi:alkanesulfonate monooxygenase SsuD/methylene tetrahydromethanopterin reductase-like flavin-dependent oxidoreductase (luciferase family)
MDFGLYLPCYWPDTSIPMQRLYADAVEAAVLAEDSGFNSFSIPEHHFSNALVHPEPLLTAIKVASATKRATISTATTVLPYHEIPKLAGEIAQADCLTDGRIQIGVGRGAYKYEFDRFRVSQEESGEIFSDSLQLLIKLLSEEEVTWDSKYYKLPPTTITPRPVQQPHPPIWFAAVTPGGIDYAVSIGLHVMTTPLRGSFEKVMAQTDAFFGAMEKYKQPDLKMSMLIMMFVTKDQSDIRRLAELALERHRRFLNMTTTGGTVKRGAIVPFESDISVEEIEKNLIIGPPEFCIEQLAKYEALGIHNLQLNMNFGCGNEDVLGSIERFATHVLPNFA